MKRTKLLLVGLSFTSVLVFSGCVVSQNTEVKTMAKKNNSPILTTYAKIAKISYDSALADAKLLKIAIDNFVTNPNEDTLQAAKNTWLASRESYGKTESFRLSNGPIDAEDGWVAKTYHNLESQINAWPLDENMIDYTIDADGKRTSGNIIDTAGLFNPGGEDSISVDVSKIDVKSLAALNENGGEANISTGYHAIEFLLWGQDQDYSNMLKDSITHGPMAAGKRFLSDFTSDKYASRRLSYLKASANKLVFDLQTIASAWSNDGLYRKALLNELTGADASKNIPRSDALKQIITGMGLFIKSELANERIAVAVLTPSEEDEHSCFSDNTHRDIVDNYQSFKNILTGSYMGKSYGSSLLDTVGVNEKTKIIGLMESIEAKIKSVNDIALTTAHFDYQIRPDNPQSKIIVKLKNQLRKLGDQMVVIAKANGISLTTNDITDPDESKDYLNK